MAPIAEPAAAGPMSGRMKCWRNTRVRPGDASLEPLPQGMGLNISMRRSVRTGQHSGLPVENFGVAADFVHRLTYEDLIHDNVDLLNYTASLLS